jgi:hypothetical protein
MSEDNNVFRPEYRELTESEKADVSTVKDIAFQLYKALENSALHDADPRCVAMARTKLEECAMWAVKGITK